MAKRVVGFIGLGLMGRGMAKNILKKGNDLLVMAHTNRAPINELVAMGAREAKSPRELAEAADTIVICVTGSPQVEGVVRGKDGILAGAKPGLLVIDSSTADPVSTAALAAEMQEKGVSLVDAPSLAPRRRRRPGLSTSWSALRTSPSPGQSRSSSALGRRSCMSARSAPATR